MQPQIERILGRIRAAEQELAREVEEQQKRWHYTIHGSTVRFERDARAAHKRLKQSVPAFLRELSVRNLLTAPVIYSLIVPLMLLDLSTTLYQRLCFPLYGIACVPRRGYFIIDRHKLSYLNVLEKLNCDYCSYANGLIAYVREIAARTEQYWCPIKHARAIHHPHSHYHNFVDYGDACGYRNELITLRRALREEG